MDSNDLGDIWYKPVVIKGSTVNGEAIEVNYDTHEVTVEFHDGTSAVYKAEQIELASTFKIREYVAKFFTLSIEQQKAILFDVVEKHYNTRDGEWSDGDETLNDMRAKIGLK